MDYTVTQPFYNYTRSALSVTAVIVVISLYVGLRTGILENLIPYLAFKKTRSTALGFDTVVAIGIGFGAAEAIVLGAYNLNVIYTLLQKLEILTLLSPVSLDQQSLINVLLPAVERLFVLFIHVFAIALVYYSLKGYSPKLLMIAIVYKTITDGMILPVMYYSGSEATWAIQACIVILGILGLGGLYWLKITCAKDKVNAGATNLSVQPVK